MNDLETNPKIKPMDENLKLRVNLPTNEVEYPDLREIDETVCAALNKHFELNIRVASLRDNPLVINESAREGMRFLGNKESLDGFLTYIMKKYNPVDLGKEGLSLQLEGITLKDQVGEPLHLLYVLGCWPGFNRLYIMNVYKIDEPGSDSFLDLVTELKTKSETFMQAMKQIAKETGSESKFTHS